MKIIHFMSRAQLDALFPLFAKLQEADGIIHWVAPAWWYVAYDTARR